MVTGTVIRAEAKVVPGGSTAPVEVVEEEEAAAEVAL
jgi:hypothetical protein